MRVTKGSDGKSSSGEWVARGEMKRENQGDRGSPDTARSREIRVFLSVTHAGRESK